MVPGMGSKKLLYKPRKFLQEAALFFGTSEVLVFVEAKAQPVGFGMWV